MLFIARIFKLIFKFSFFRKYYFGLYKRIFKPWNLFHKKSTICKYDGNLKMEVDLDDWIQQNVFFFGVYDPLNINYLKKVLKEGDVFLDIGANVGCFSLVASKVTGNTGKVFSFEPVEYVAERLEKNIRINNITNIRLVRNAVFNTETELELHISSRENMGMSSFKRHDTESGIIQKVRTITIDKFLVETKIEKVDWVKIDIEGAEIYALEGMKDTIENYCPSFLVEVSGQVLKEVDERQKVFDFFSARAYSRFALDDNGNLILVGENESADFTNFIFIKQ